MMVRVRAFVTHADCIQQTTAQSVVLSGTGGVPLAAASKPCAHVPHGVKQLELASERYEQLHRSAGATKNHRPNERPPDAATMRHKRSRSHRYPHRQQPRTLSIMFQSPSTLLL